MRGFGDGTVVDRGGTEVAHRTAPAAGTEWQSFPEEPIQFGEILAPDQGEESLAVLGIVRFAQPATQVASRLGREAARRDCGPNHRNCQFHRLLVRV